MLLLNTKVCGYKRLNISTKLYEIIFLRSLGGGVRARAHVCGIQKCTETEAIKIHGGEYKTKQKITKLFAAEVKKGSLQRFELTLSCRKK